MQFPGCHTPILKTLQDENDESSTDSSQNQCKNTIPPTLDTYKNLEYNGMATLSGIFSLSTQNKLIKLNLDGGAKIRSTDCLQGNGPSKVKVYLELLEELYVNRRIPIKLNKVTGSSTKYSAKEFTGTNKLQNDVQQSGNNNSNDKMSQENIEISK